MTSLVFNAARYRNEPSSAICCVSSVGGLDLARREAEVSRRGDGRAGRAYGRQDSELCPLAANSGL